MRKHLLVFVAAVGFCQAQSAITAVSSASYQTPVAPASLVTVFGSNLANTTAQAQLDSSGQLPTELGGITVQAGGQAAQLLYVSPGQINLVMPAAIASGTAEIVIQQSGSTQTLRTNIEVRNTAPALFSLNATGAGAGAILNGVTFTGGPFQVETSANLGDDKRTRLAIYGTGIRYAGNPFLDPSLTNAAASVNAQVSDKAGNIYTLPVEYAGAAPTWFGLDQVNVVVPPQLDGLGQLSLTLTAGQASSNIVTFNVNSLPAEALRLVGVSLSPTSVLSGGTISGTVTLNAPAKTGGFVVSLASSSTFVQTPGSVTVPPGEVSVAFNLVTNSTGAGTATITASANGISRSALLTVHSANGPSLSSVTVTSSSISGGTSVTGKVTLSGSAPAEGAVVQLSSDSTAVQPPATVTVPFGQTSANFTFTTAAVSTATPVTLTATYAGGTQSVALKVSPLFTFELSAESVTGGQSVTGTINLASPAPAQGAIINLASNDIVTARVSPFVTVPAGQSSITVTITTATSTLPHNVTLTATYSNISVPVTLAVVPAGTATLSGLLLNPSTVKGGNTVTGTISLTNAVTGFNGVTVTLQSSSKLAAQTPTSVIVPVGQSTAKFTITTAAVTSTQNVTITASAGGVSKTASLVVQ